MVRERGIVWRVRGDVAFHTRMICPVCEACLRSSEPGADVCERQCQGCGATMRHPPGWRGRTVPTLANSARGGSGGTKCTSTDARTASDRLSPLAPMPASAPAQAGNAAIVLACGSRPWGCCDPGGVLANGCRCARPWRWQTDKLIHPSPDHDNDRWVVRRSWTPHAPARARHARHQDRA